jgi:hypothetical protein
MQSTKKPLQFSGRLQHTMCRWFRLKTTRLPIIYWYKKEGEKWRHFNCERGDVQTGIYAENDNEMVQITVYGSLSDYALQHFVLWREHNGRDPYRKYDEFMEECLCIVYPERKFRRHPEYDDQKYAKLDADYLKGHSFSK